MTRVTESGPASERSDLQEGVVRVDSGHREHLEALASFYRKVWDESATADSVARSRAREAQLNPAAPGEEVPTFLFLLEGEAVAHLSTIPVRISVGGKTSVAHWLKGLWVLPEYRNGPVGFAVLREALEQVDTGLALVGDPAARRLFTALGCEDLGPIPNYVSVLNPARVLRRVSLDSLGFGGTSGLLPTLVRFSQSTAVAGVSGLMYRVASGGWRALRGMENDTLTVSPEEGTPADADQLWSRTDGARQGASLVRDARYLERRYVADGRGEAYQVFHARGPDDRLEACAVVRRPRAQGDPRLRGIRVATLSEVLCPSDRPESGYEVLKAVERWARGRDVDAIVASATHPELRSLLRRRAFLPLPGNLHLLVRGGPEGPDLPNDLGRWWVTRGDSNADKVF